MSTPVIYWNYQCFLLNSANSEITHKSEWEMDLLLWYSHIINVQFFFIVYQEENSLQVQLISEQKNVPVQQLKPDMETNIFNLFCGVVFWGIAIKKSGLVNHVKVNLPQLYFNAYENVFVSRTITIKTATTKKTV